VTKHNPAQVLAIALPRSNPMPEPGHSAKCILERVGHESMFAFTFMVQRHENVRAVSFPDRDEPGHAVHVVFNCDFRPNVVEAAQEGHAF
jgi:hypothetical protein